MLKLLRTYLYIIFCLISISVFAQPNADFTSNVQAGCEPLLVQFNSHSSVQGSNYSHSWNLGGTNSTQPNPSKAFLSSGTYTITHTVTGPSGSNTTTKTDYITVHPKPVADFSGSPLLGCPPMTVSFTDKSTLNTPGAGTYFWIFTNSAPSTAQNPTNVYNDGPYDVTLKVINSKGCPAELTKKNYVDVYDKPAVTFTANVTEFCAAPGTVNFSCMVNGNLGPYTYDWDFGDGSTHATTQNTSHTFTGPAPKYYTVTLTVTDKNNCKTIVSKKDYVKIYDPLANFTSPDTVCLNSQVSFTNTSQSGTSGQIWNFGDGSPNVITVNSQHSYGTPGSYNVRLIAFYGNGCSDTLVKSLYVLPRSNVDFYIDPDTLCPAPQTVKFYTYSTFTNYNWFFGDNVNNTSTLASPTHTYNNNGQYTVRFVGTNKYGCTDTLTKYHYVKIFPLDTLQILPRDSNGFFTLDEGCIPLKIHFKSLLYRDSGIIYPYPIKTYSWDFGDGSTSNQKDPIHIYTDTGKFTVILNIETVQGCLKSDTVQVQAGMRPTANFTANPLIACNKEMITFTNLSTGWPPMKYEWSFGDGTIALGPSPTYAYSDTGTYTVSLAASHYGCWDTFVRRDYIKVLPPDAKFSAQSDCDSKLKVTFTDLSDGSDSAYWDFGDGNTSTVRNPVHTYATDGSYIVTIWVYNFATGCADSIHKTLYFGKNSPDFIQNKRALCEEDSVEFWSYLNKDTSAAIFDWYVNGVKYANDLDKYTHTFNTAGLYTIKVISVDDYGCKDSVEKVDWITVGRPRVGFMSPNPMVCEPDTVNFTDTSYTLAGTTIATRLWRYGTGVNDTFKTTGANASNVYTQRGDYDVTLIVTDNIGCKDSVTYSKYVHVLKPVADFTVDTNVCVHELVTFTNNSVNAVNQEWLLGDGNNSNAFEPKHRYTTKGSFNPTLIVTDSFGCKDTVTLKSVTTHKPDASFTMSDSISICPNFVVKFTSTSTNYRTLRWDFDNGNSSTFRDPTTIFIDPDQYDVSLVVKDSLGCTDTAVRTIQVLGYGGAFTYDTTNGCVPLTVNFESQVNGRVPSMIWDFGDGVTKQIAQSGKVAYTYTTPGKYLPQMVFNDGLGCNTSSQGNDTIYVDDIDADFEYAPACEYSLVQFNDKSTSFLSSVSSTLWTFHDGTFSANSNPKHYYGPPGQYNVKLVVANQRGCKDTMDTDITIHRPLPVNAGADTIICLGDSAILRPSGGVSYVWSPASKLSCTACENPRAFPVDSSKFTVISTDINGCHDTAGVWVGIKTKVTSTAGGDGEICDGETRQLKVSGGTSYLWIPGTGLSDATSSSPDAGPSTTTIYTVVAYEGSCIPDTNMVEVVVHPRPVVEVQGEATIVAGNTADLLATGTNIARYEWSPSRSLSCADCQNPIAEPYKTTRYVVRVFSKFECVDSADVTITVLCDKSQVFIPNTFTPNGDGVNDVFYVRGVGIENIRTFRIYSRWGELMFERSNIQINDKQNAWDGTFNGKVLPPDVYVYMVEGDCENGDVLKWKGDVTIVR